MEIDFTFVFFSSHESDLSICWFYAKHNANLFTSKRDFNENNYVDTHSSSGREIARKRR